MKSRQEYIRLLEHLTPTLKSEYGVKSLCIFGSVARDEQKEGSDVDVCVDMEPKMFLVIRLKRLLESVLGSSVDVVRLRKSLNPYLKSEIDRDAIYVFR